MRIAMIGFGEAAQTFVEAWGRARSAHLRVYDIKTDDPDARAGKLADYARFGLTGAEDSEQALGRAELVFSLVTADECTAAARASAPRLSSGALYLDMNSAAPATKQAAAQRIEASGGRYADVAVMAPVRTNLADVPMLVAGPHAEAARAALTQLGFAARVVGGPVGSAATIKMTRSIMIKGIEALTAECLLTARAAGVEAEVIASLDASFDGWDWRARADYNLDRMLVHGRRRAEEMRASAETAAGFGQSGAMARASAEWQQRLGDLGLAPLPAGFDAKADAIIDQCRKDIA